MDEVEVSSVKQKQASVSDSHASLGPSKQDAACQKTVVVGNKCSSDSDGSESDC